MSKNKVLVTITAVLVMITLVAVARTRSGGTESELIAVEQEPS